MPTTERTTTDAAMKRLLANYSKEALVEYLACLPQDWLLGVHWDLLRAIELRHSLEARSRLAKTALTIERRLDRAHAIAREEGKIRYLYPVGRCCRHYLQLWQRYGLLREKIARLNGRIEGLKALVEGNKKEAKS